MIGNITKGNGFYGCVAYVLGKKDAQLINTNMAGGTPAQLAWEFRSFANKNQRVQKPVLHLSFSPAPGDRSLDEWELCQIAQDLLNGLKLSNNQFILVQHNDAEFDSQPRPHAHMVINRVSYDGECNDDYLDYYRTEKILRQIEQQYDLIIQPSSWEVQKKKAYPKHVQQTEESGEPNIVERLQNSIEQAAADQPAMPVFVARLLKENIQVDCKFTRTGKLKGISYCVDGQPFKGGDLGKLYTHIGIREHLKVSYLEDYRYPIESVIESFKRGRTINDKWVNYLESWIEWNFKQDSSSDGASEETATIEVLSTQDNSTANLEPALEEVPTIANELFAKKQTVVGEPPPKNTTEETTQSQEFEEVPALITEEGDSEIILGGAAEPSALPPEVPTVAPTGEVTITLLSDDKTPSLEGLPEAMASERPSGAANARLEAPGVATPTNSDDSIKVQHENAKAIAQTVLLLWSQQDLVKKSKKYDLQLGEDNIIYVSHKSGEIIASIPLNENQTPRGIALTKVDVDNFQKIQQILDARQKLQTKPSNLAGGIEL